jgi:hypothetical protein
MKTKTIHTERWFVRADGKGTYEARFEMARNGTVTGEGAAREGITLDEAVAHCAMAIRHDAEKTEKSALIDEMLDKSNWKLPTARKTVATVGEARRIREALNFFLGGSEVRQTKGDGGMPRIEVGSLGYYHYIGA